MRQLEALSTRHIAHSTQTKTRYLSVPSLLDLVKITRPMKCFRPPLSTSGPDGLGRDGGTFELPRSKSKRCPHTWTAVDTSTGASDWLPANHATYTQHLAPIQRTEKITPQSYLIMAPEETNLFQSWTNRLSGWTHWIPIIQASIIRVSSLEHSLHVFGPQPLFST